MQRLNTTKYLTVWYVLGWLALCWSGSGCTESEPGATESADKAAREPKAAPKHPSPSIELTSHEGELCAADTIGFSSNDGAFTLTTSTEPSGTPSCNLHLEVTVPAGYSFKRPIISSSGIAVSLMESSPPTEVKITYELDGRSLTSHHDVPAARAESGDSESYVLVDTPDIELRACDHAEEPEVFDLRVNIEASIPDETIFRLSALDGEFDIGVPWFECAKQD